MPYTTLVAGTTITASWANASVRDQVVTPFASASARTSAITSPVEGMLSYQADVDLFYYYDGSAWVVIPAMIAARKTADEVVNNSSTLQNDNHLSWPVAANAVYEMRLELVYVTGTTPDIKFGWTYPSGLTMVWQHRGTDLSGNVAFRGNYNAATVLGIGGTTFEEYVTLTGLITVSSTAGTLQLQWAQSTANASDTTLRSGSYGILTRIA